VGLAGDEPAANGTETTTASGRRAEGNHGAQAPNPRPQGPTHGLPLARAERNSLRADGYLPGKWDAMKAASRRPSCQRTRTER